MLRCIAFLQATDVGGRFARTEALGLAEARSFIASGNVISETRRSDLTALERKSEAHLKKSFGFTIQTFIRSETELDAIVAHPAFDAGDVAVANTPVVAFIVRPPDAAGAELIEGSHTEADRFHLHGRELHSVSRRKQSEVGFPNATSERALKTRTTFRNIATLRKLHEKMSACIRAGR